MKLPKYRVFSCESVAPLNFFTQNDKNITNRPFVLQNYLILVCCKVTRKLPFSIFTFELFNTDLFNVNKQT